MKKGRNKSTRSIKREAAPSAPTIELQPLADPRWRKVWTFLKSRLGYAVGIIGALAALLALWDGYWVTRPEIHVLGPDPSSTFALPFAVKNPSRLFAMENVQWFCGINKLDLKQGGGLANFSITEASTSFIGAGETRNFRCSINVKADDVRTGSLALFVKFKTFYIPRVSDPQLMTWVADATPPRWVEGEIGALARP